MRQLGAEKYLLLTLISFAISVSFTRLFLFLTGYPQLGGGELHIAHVLWGGLLLFVASLLPLILANRWTLSVSAVLSGAGMGLFIDEVGKFITRTNNYFYAPAAPIIYVVFLMTALVYILVKRPRSDDVRTNLYYTLQDLQEVLDHDLSESEQKRIWARLQVALEDKSHSNVRWLTKSLVNFIASDRLHLVAEESTPITRWQDRLRIIEERHLNQMRLRAVLVGSLIAVGMWALSYPLTILFRIPSPQGLEAVLYRLVLSDVLRSPFELTLFQVRVGFEGAIGLLLVVAAILLAFRLDRRAIYMAYLTLLFSLTIVAPLLFYFEQFSTIITASVHLFILLGVLYFRDQVISEAEAPPPPESSSNDIRA